MSKSEDPGARRVVHAVLGKALSVGVAIAVTFAGVQGVTAFGASSPAPSPQPGKAQRIAVEQAVAVSVGKALGVGNGEKLIVKDVITDADGSTNVRYDRTFEGLRVIGGDLVSHRDKSGRIKGVSWSASHSVAVPSTQPTIPSASAETTGAQKAAAAQKTTAGTKGELVVYAGRVSAKVSRVPTKPIPRLAYDVLTEGVRADQTPSRLHTIVDAKTGAALASWDEIENGTGNGIFVGAVPVGTTGASGSYSMRDVAGNTTTDLNGSTAGTGTTFTDADDIWGNSAVSDRASAAVDAHYGAERTFDYFKNVLGRNGIWDNGAGARSRVHYGTNYENAFWDGSQMTYGDGAGNAHPLVELDVAGHEMSHGVTEDTAGFFYAGESGGLDEATSDIFGTSVEWYANNASDTPDYNIGELINLNGDGTPLRYMDQPSRDGLSPDCWSPTVGDLDPHYSSGPLNHWFYLASEGSGAKVINGISYDSPTCGGAPAVTPIGRDAAAKIWYRTLTTYLTSGSTYAAARDGAIQSAKDLYPAVPSMCTGIEASFLAIGVPPGAATCAATPPPPSGSNLLSNPGFESGDTLWSSTPNVIDQWGAYEPTHSGIYDAWLGGYDSTHDDSISQLLTIPSSSSATLKYYLHIDTNEAAGSLAYDTLTVRAGSTVLQTLSNVDAADGYQLRTVDLSGYVGKTISLSFSGSEDASLATSFVLDDLSVTTPDSVPEAPTGVSATAGDAQSLVSWAAPASDGGSAITGYTVTAVPGGATATTTGATTATVAGLTNGSPYTFTVTATNAVGTSPASVSSGAVTPRAVPGAPMGVSATAGDAQALVSWAAPASDGGSAITGYSVRVVNATTSAQVGALQPAAATATTLTVTGLGNGTAYTFQVQATNAAGTGPRSAASNAVTPSSATAAVTRLSDFNRDGFTDQVARDSAGILWLYPGDGAGGFLARVQLGTGWGAFTAIVTPGDVTGDGNADVLARDAGGTLWLYPGDGISGLGARRAIGSGWNVMNLVTDAGDMTGDARADVLARDTSGNLWVYPLSGNAAFGTRRLVASGWNGMTAIMGPGDVSGDGRADVLARDTAGGLWLYPGNGASGIGAGTLVSGGWQAMTSIVTPGNWDRAGGNDLLARDAAGTLWLYLGDNAGGFGAPRQIATGWQSFGLPPAVPSPPTYTRLTDFNRDGFTDLVARDTSGNLWLYPGNGAGSFLSRVQLATGWGAFTAIVSPGDVTGDGNADIIARDSAGRLWLYPGNGTSGLSAQRQIGSGWNVMNWVTAAGDMNGDGRPDLLARDTSGVLWLYPLSGNAVFGSRIQVATGWGAMTSILGPGDVSGDGRADVLARDAAGVLWLYRGNGSGGVAAGTQVSTGWQAMTALVTPGNWDRAGGNDLLARDAAGVLWLYPGDDAGGFGSRRQIGSGWNIMNYIG